MKTYVYRGSVQVCPLLFYGELSLYLIYFTAHLPYALFIVCSFYLGGKVGRRRKN